MSPTAKCLGKLNIKFCTLLLLPLLTSPLLFIGEKHKKEWKCVYTILLVIGYGILNAFPMHLAYLLPIVLFPILGILDTSTVVSCYMRETAMMILGFSVVGQALQLSKSHERVILKIMTITSSSPYHILTGVFFASAALSTVMDPILVVTIMFPICTSISDQLGCQEFIQDDGEILELEVHEQIAQSSTCLQDVSANKPQIVAIEDQTPNVQVHNGLKPALLICMTTGYTVGSKCILFGSTINILYLQLLESQGTFDKSELNFLTWLIFNGPIMLISFPFVWFVLCSYFLGNPFSFKKKREPILSKQKLIELKKTLSRRYNELGSMNSRELTVLSILTLLILIWMTRDPKLIPGWSQLFSPDTKVGYATPTIFIAFILLILPTKWPTSNQSYETFISWSHLESNFPWGILFIIGGGCSISEGIVKSGLSHWIELQLAHLDDIPKELTLIILLIIASLSTEFISGKVCLLIFHPIVMALSLRLEVHPLYFGLPIAVACSYGFMIPSGVIYLGLMFTWAKGDVKITDLIKVGAILNFGLILILFAMNITWGEFVFKYSEYSNNATLAVQ